MAICYHQLHHPTIGEVGTSQMQLNCNYNSTTPSCVRLSHAVTEQKNSSPNRRRVFQGGPQPRSPLGVPPRNPSYLYPKVLKRAQ